MKKIVPVSLNGENLLVSEAISRGVCIHLLHTPIGIVYPLICHDLSQQLADTTLVNILQRLPIDILLVSSLSEHVTAHLRSAKGVGLTRNMAIVIANQANVEFTNALSSSGWGKNQSGAWRSGDSQILEGSDGQMISLKITQFTADGQSSTGEVNVQITDLAFKKISLNN